jgi:large subunit ribosomal protein L31
MSGLRVKTMKADIHPKLNPVVFIDGQHEIVTHSTLTSNEKKAIDGVDHFIVHVDISGHSHPFYTGKQRLVDTAGRIERFKARYNKK